MVTPQTERLIAEHLGPISKSLRDLESKLLKFGAALRQEASLAIVFEPDFDKQGQIARYRELDAGAACDDAELVTLLADRDDKLAAASNA